MPGLKLPQGVHYVTHPLADLWVDVTLVDGERLVVVDSATHAAAGQTILPYLTDQALPRAGQPVRGRA